MENNQENTQESGLAMLPKLAQLDHVNFGTQIANNIKEGNVDPLTIHLFLKRFEKIQEMLKEDEEVKEAINNAASKYAVDGKSFDLFGAKLTIGAVHTAYDFTDCNDPVWTSLNDIEKKVKYLKGEREKFLKNAFPEKEGSLFGISAPVVVVDKLLTLEETDCGEEVTLNKPRKIQKTGVKVSFPKK